MKADKNCNKDVNLKPWRMAALATMILMGVVALMMVPPAAGASAAWALELLAPKAVAAAWMWAAWRLAYHWGMLPHMA